MIKQDKIINFGTRANTNSTGTIKRYRIVNKYVRCYDCNIIFSLLLINTTRDYQQAKELENLIKGLSSKT